MASPAACKPGTVIDSAATDATAEPLVSVIIAAHNSEATLAETLSSATASTYRNIEVIVVDDGSTDGTGAIVERAARRNPTVRLLRQTWGGVAAAYNAGLAEARGEFVARLDSDDLWHPTKLAKQVAFARNNPDAAFIYTDVRSIDGEGRVLHDVPEQRFPSRALCRSIYESLIGTNSSALIRRQVLEDVGGDDAELQSRQDLMIQLKISAQHAIGYVPEYLVGYRVSERSLSSTPDAMLASWEVIRRRIEVLFPLVPSRVRRWADARQYSELAEGFAWQRRYASSAQLLLRALMLDPARLSLFLCHRMARRLRGRARDSWRAPLFTDCDPTVSVRPREIGLGSGRRQLDALDERRNLKLAALDRELASGA
jgi:glycosyltransferase involved in cell wall biosynthesis